MEKKYSFWQILMKGWLVLVIVALVAIGACMTYSYNFNKNRGFYEFKYSYTEDVDIKAEDIISSENISKTQGVETSYYTGGKISTYSYVNATNKLISIKEENKIYTILLNVDSLANLPEGSKEETVAKGFLKHLAIMSFDTTKYEDFINDKGKTVKGVTLLFNEESNTINKITDNNQRDKLIMWGFIGLGIGLFVGIGLVLILGYKYQDKLEKENIYDNDTVFRTPFHIKYWSLSCHELSNVKKLMIMAILLGLTLCSKFIPIPSGFGNLGLGWGFLFLGVGALLLGPVPALIMGACSDTLGYFINSAGGMFFFGYTIQAMLACFIYGLLFYRTRVNFTRVLLARVLVNFVANVIIGSICWGIISDFNLAQTMDYMFVISLPKNIAYLIPQSLLLYVVIRCVVPIADASNFIEPKIAENVTIF